MFLRRSFGLDIESSSTLFNQFCSRTLFANIVRLGLDPPLPRLKFDAFGHENVINALFCGMCILILLSLPGELHRYIKVARGKNVDVQDQDLTICRWQIFIRLQKFTWAWNQSSIALTSQKQEWSFISTLETKCLYSAQRNVPDKRSNTHIKTCSLASFMKPYQLQRLGL
jgi:hypothetical protein